MAEAEKQLIEIPVISVVEQFTLYLDRDEAQVLHDILARVGGDQLNSRRRFADSIYHALQQVSTFVDDTEVYRDVSPNASIYFDTTE